jgi:hypothetical protein
MSLPPGESYTLVMQHNTDITGTQISWGQGEALEHEESLKKAFESLELELIVPESMHATHHVHE